MRAVFQTLAIFVDVYSWIYLIYIFIGYFTSDRSNIFIRAIDSICYPVDQFIERRLPKLQFGMMDFSPFYVLIFCWVLEAVFRVLAGIVR